MKRDRIISFVDGFNLYHAIDNLNTPPLKWLDLTKLSQHFLHPIREELIEVRYFSTIALHCAPDVQARQQSYLKALQATGANTILGQFKQKSRRCNKCFVHYTSYEEKETDVNIALDLIELAYADKYDRAILVTNDSDQVPAIRKVLTRFPSKKVTILIPPHSRACNELIQVASNKAKITIDHLEFSLFPEIVNDKLDQIIKRPKAYDTSLVGSSF